MVMGTSGYLLDQAMAKKCKEPGSGPWPSALIQPTRLSMTHSAVQGVWERAVDAVRFCREEEIGVQINMSVMQSAMSDVREVIEVGTALGVRDYQIFFPVPTEGHS